MVGTTLCFVNGTFESAPPSRIALNYLVPLLVAACSRLLTRAGAGREVELVDRPLIVSVRAVLARDGDDRRHETRLCLRR